MGYFPSVAGWGQTIPTFVLPQGQKYETYKPDGLLLISFPSTVAENNGVANVPPSQAGEGKEVSGRLLGGGLNPSSLFFHRPELKPGCQTCCTAA